MGQIYVYLVSCGQTAFSFCYWTKKKKAVWQSEAGFLTDSPMHVLDILIAMLLHSLIHRIVCS